MNRSYENQRKYHRWYLCTQQESPEQQSQGVSIEIRGGSRFGRKVGRAIIKDISLGGAGILLSAKQPIPEVFRLVYQNSYSSKAEVVYRRPLNGHLIFCGIRWYESNRHKRLKMLRLLRQLKRQALMPEQRPELQIALETNNETE